MYIYMEMKMMKKDINIQNQKIDDLIHRLNMNALERDRINEKRAKFKKFGE